MVLFATMNEADGEDFFSRRAICARFVKTMLNAEMGTTGA
jgi:hypothetical protein